jgi:nicotinamidase-related amidase
MRGEQMNIPKLGQFTEEWILQRAEQQYRESQASIEVDPGHTALVVVDMIDEFVKPNWCPYWVPDATRQVPAINRVIDSFHESKAPVIYLAYHVSLRGLNFPITEWVVPVGAGLSQFDNDLLQRVSIYEELEPSAEDLVILKNCYSGFQGTPLDLVLKSQQVSTIVICGTMTNYCCGSTAREAFWHGYKVIFGSDINSCDSPMHNQAELDTLRRGFARIMDSDEIVGAMHEAHAGTRSAEPAAL